MDETRIPQISNEIKKRIKEIVKYHYGFTTNDDDIYRIDNMLRNHYAVLHDQRIIRELVAGEAGKELLKHRDRLGSLEFERIWLEKTIFKHLTLASMCYRAGIPAGTISLCRTAIESGLRERLAEELARKESASNAKLPEATWKKLKGLKHKKMADLIQMAAHEGIIGSQDIEEAFRKLKLRDQSSRRILDKFIHGDIVWMVSFVREREEDTRVVGAQDLLEEYKIVSEMSIDQIAVEVLRVTYKIAETLYFRDI
jgi:hypothetical protein